MPYFITNSNNNNLLTRVNELVKNSKELKFLTGFFYFTGLKEFYEALKENNNTTLKVLVGLRVDYNNFRLIEVSYDKNLSTQEITDDYISSVCRSLRDASLDSKEVYEQVRFFLELIAGNKLIIKKTVEPNHSKLYLFYLKDDQIGRNRLFITGSSNLTAAGLNEQNEFNVEIGDYGFNEAENYFDNLWNEAVEITEYQDTRERLIKSIINQTFLREVNPFEAYCLVLHNYIRSIKDNENIEGVERILREANYKPYKYQVDAINQAYGIINNFGGVLIADVVGLGKTVIACALARKLKERGLVICPPGLIGDENKRSGWKKYLEDFRLFDWEVKSSGKLDEALEFVRDKRRGDIGVVIVDEAHRYRNDDTEAYEYLKNIVRGKKVILLTATPFNNHPYDILNLISLFINKKKSNITLTSNLYLRFMEYENTLKKFSYILKNYNSANIDKKNRALSYYSAMFGDEQVDKTRIAAKTRYISKRIRSIIEPITIRRNRIDLEKNPDYKEEVGELSKIADPQNNEDKTDWYYELDKDQMEFYNRVINEYFKSFEDGGKFYGAIYRPFEYERIDASQILSEIGINLNEQDNREFQQQRNLYGFMQRLLVKRFESSFGAFKKSLENFKNVAEICEKFIGDTKKFILDRGLIEKIYDKSADEIDTALKEYADSLKNSSIKPKNAKIYEVSKFKREDEFKKHIRSDIQLFENVIKEIDKLKLVDNDPKAECLIKELKKRMAEPQEEGEPERKFVIFSEYKDTVEHLYDKLKAAFGEDKILKVAGDLSEGKILEINKNFDASYSEQENKYRILLTTDKISEGFNLNRAQYVINYDIPWNPVRVIQRLGRINRISKKVFNTLYIVNFFPTERGANIVQSKIIAQQKMFIIHNILGEDAKIFDIDEVPEASKLFERLRGDPERLEGESTFTKLYVEYLRLKEENKDLFEGFEGGEYPPRIKVAKKSDKNELLVFFKKKRMFAASIETSNLDSNAEEIPVEEAIERIKCNKDEKGLEWNNENFWRCYNKVIKDQYRDPKMTKDNGLEQKALNKIYFLLRDNRFEKSKDFLRILKEDILYYGTLPDYTLRRISEIKDIAEVEELKKMMGMNYLLTEKLKHSDEIKDVIIAIENKSNV